MPERIDITKSTLWPRYENSEEPVEYYDIVSACELYDDNKIRQGEFFSFVVQFRVNGPWSWWMEIEDENGNDYQVNSDCVYLEAKHA